MRLLILLALLLSPLVALAQFVPPSSFNKNDTITVWHTAPGFEVYLDQSGNRVDVYKQTDYSSAYTTQDKDGKITSQGFIFDPIPPSRSRDVPPWQLPWELTDEPRR